MPTFEAHSGDVQPRFQIPPDSADAEYEDLLLTGLMLGEVYDDDHDSSDDMDSDGSDDGFDGGYDDSSGFE